VPTSFIDKLVADGKGTKKDLEAKWNRAKAIAAKEGKKDNFAFITAIFKKLAKINESEELDEGIASAFLSFVMDKIKEIQVSREIKKQYAIELARFMKAFEKSPGGQIRDKFDAKINKLAKKFSKDIPEGVTRRIIASIEDSIKKKNVDNSAAFSLTSSEIIPFKDYIEEAEFVEYLTERLISIQQGKKFNQVVILSGGAGSGKSFAVDNFINSTDFKVFSLDDTQKMAKKISDVAASLEKYANLSPQQLDDLISTGKLSQQDKSIILFIKKNPKLKNLAHLDVDNVPADVVTLHNIMKELALEDKIFATLAKVIPEKSDHKPNLLFDTTAKSKKKLREVVDRVLVMGYRPENIHLIWVLTKYKIALIQNRERDRVLPDDVVFETANGAATTMFDVIGAQHPPIGMNGEIWTILNNKKNTLFWQHGDGKLKGTPEFHLPIDKKNQNPKTSKLKGKAYDKIYGSGAFARLNARQLALKKANADAPKLVIKSFMRIKVKKAGSKVGEGVPPFKLQLLRWVISNVPKTSAFKIIAGIFKRGFVFNPK